jgi:hypothetical protein
MADNKQQQKQQPAKAGTVAAPSAPSNGSAFQRPGDEWVAVTSQIAGWFEKAPGKPAVGTIRGRFERGGADKGAYYLMELSAPISAMKADKVVVELAPGEFLAIGENFGLKILDSCEGCKVRIEALEKQTLKTGKSFWVFDVRIAKESMTRHEANKRQPARTGEAQADGDEIPF